MLHMGQGFFIIKESGHRESNVTAAFVEKLEDMCNV